MKCVPTLLAGSVLLSLTTPLSAQLDGWLGKALKNHLPSKQRTSTNATTTVTESTTADQDPWVPPHSSESVINRASLHEYCEKIAITGRKVFFINDQSFRMSLRLHGIYTHEETIYLQLALSNHSHLDYDTDSIRLFVTDKQSPRTKRVATIGISPLYMWGNTHMIKGKSREIWVIALTKFTLPANKQLVIKVKEKNGGRNLSLPLDNFTLVRARLI